jgi:hypothetical protein
MGRSEVPMNCAGAIDRLCEQIEVLFQPLRDHFEESCSEGVAPIPSLEDQFRDLHEIVTAAADLSVKIRLSSTIFYFNSELPGNPFNQENQTNIDQPAYLASKAAVAASLEGKRKVDQQGSVSTKYGPLIKFAVWPSIRRYSPGNGKADGTNNGYRIYEICKSRVVCYWGPKHPPWGREQCPQEFIDQRRRDNMGLVKIFAEGWGQNKQNIKSPTTEIRKWKALVGIVVPVIILCAVIIGAKYIPETRNITWRIGNWTLSMKKMEVEKIALLRSQYWKSQRSRI